MYVQGFVVPVPADKEEEYRDLANKFWPIAKEFGATEHVEVWEEDVPDGKQTDFRRAVQAKEDETVVFSWVEWPDKATRDAGMKKMMDDPRMDPKTNPMPFDGMRMIFGGFQPVLDISGKAG